MVALESLRGRAGDAAARDDLSAVSPELARLLEDSVKAHMRAEREAGALSELQRKCAEALAAEGLELWFGESDVAFDLRAALEDLRLKENLPTHRRAWTDCLVAFAAQASLREFDARRRRAEEIVERFGWRDAERRLSRAMESEDGALQAICAYACLAAAEAAWAAGNGAFDSLLREICGFRCASLEDLRAKSDHLFALRAELDEGMIALLLEADGRRVEERSGAGPDRPAALSPAPCDPIYALIEAHRIALAALDAAVAGNEGGEIARASAHEAGLHRRLFAARPWTLAGAAAFASYVAAMPRLEQFDEPEFSAAQAMATLAAALSSIADPAAKAA
ncbi:hypothetical protein [Methylocella sp.]|uniref:hypothetical protein n=1 Tax=Methylocella sp. TaxID=1978226 RepID=UPI003783EFA7